MFKIVLNAGEVFRLSRPPNVKKYQWYMIVCCKGCAQPIYLGEIQHSQRDTGFYGAGHISAPCQNCGVDEQYSALEIKAHKSRQNIIWDRPLRVKPSNMPRQPLDSKYPGVKATFGPGFLEDRPKAAALVARCVSLWTEVETAEARLLATLLGANTEPAIALFLVIQNSRLQFAVLESVAQSVLNEGEGNDLELFYAIMKCIAAIEKERNALVHGCFGGSQEIKEGLAWIDSVHLAQFTVKFSSTGQSEEARAWLRKKTYVYELGDLETVALKMENIHTQLNSFIGYLYSATSANPPTELRFLQYQQLIAEPQIAQAIAHLRDARKRSQQTPPE